MEGWVKLHRKLLNNKELLRDHTALTVFVWLLLRADRKTGTVETGRFVAAHDLGMNPNTFYKALTRLRNRKMVTQSSNNRFTTISIVKWHDYQASGNSAGNNKVTTGEQQSNTIQEVKNKELKNIYSSKNYLLTDQAKAYYYEKFPHLTRKRISDELENMLDWIANAPGNKGVKKDYQAFGRTWLRKITADSKPTNHIPYKPPSEFTDLGAIMTARLQND